MTDVDMNLYAALKTHVTCVTVSVTGFVLRVGCSVVTPAVLRMRAVRIVPHGGEHDHTAAAQGAAR